MHLSDTQGLQALKRFKLFQELTPTQLQEILPFIKEAKFKAGEIIIHENETSENIYLLKEGKVEIRKHDIEHNKFYTIAMLSPGDTIGEIAVFDNEPRSAAVIAVEPCTLFLFSGNDLRQLPDSTSIFSIIVNNIAKSMGSNIRQANNIIVKSLTRELELTKIRLMMSLIIIYTILILGFYIFVVRLSTSLSMQGKLLDSSVISDPLSIIFAIAAFLLIKKSRNPISTYGITLKNWRISLRESLIFSIPFLILTVLLKCLLIKMHPLYTHHHLFDVLLFTKNIRDFTLPFFSLYLMYIIFIPLQELIVRGILQSSFEKILIGPYTIIRAIIYSNILFSVIHVHISFLLAFSVLIPGIFWGWLYSRHRTLIGVTASHLLLGIWAILIVGLDP